MSYPTNNRLHIECVDFHSCLTVWQCHPVRQVQVFKCHLCVKIVRENNIFRIGIGKTPDASRWMGISDKQFFDALSSWMTVYSSNLLPFRLMISIRPTARTYVPSRCSPSMFGYIGMTVRKRSGIQKLGWITTLPDESAKPIRPCSSIIRNSPSFR